MKKSQKIIIPLVLIGVILFVALDNNTYHHLVLCQCLVNIVVVTGLNIITGLTGQMNLGTAGIMGLGAYAAALTSTRLHTPWIVGVILAVIFGLLVGRGLGYPSLRLRGVFLSLTTIGFSEIVRLILTNWVELTGGTMGVKEIPWINFFGFKFDTSRKVFYLYLAVTVLIIFWDYRVVHSKWGRVFKAIGDNMDACEALGIDIARLKILAFTIASVLGCLGGAMYAYMMGYINPTTFTQDLSSNYLAMMMIGGIGTVAGNVIGACVITIVPELLRFLQNYYWLIFSIAALLCTIFLPNGLVSLFRQSKYEKENNLAVSGNPKGDKNG